jgi:hypothetical protein
MAAGGVPLGSLVGSMASSIVRGLAGFAPDVSTDMPGWSCCVYWSGWADSVFGWDDPVSYAVIFTFVGWASAPAEMVTEPPGKVMMPPSWPMLFDAITFPAVAGGGGLLQLITVRLRASAVARIDGARRAFESARARGRGLRAARLKASPLLQGFGST